MSSRFNNFDEEKPFAADPTLESSNPRVTLRQESHSLRACAELQERDTDIMDFLESNIDFNDYLHDFPDDSDLMGPDAIEDDPTMRNEKILNHQRMLYEPFEQYGGYGGDMTTMQPVQGTSSSYYSGLAQQSSSSFSHIGNNPFARDHDRNHVPDHTFMRQKQATSNITHVAPNAKPAFSVKLEQEDYEEDISSSSRASSYAASGKTKSDAEEALKNFKPSIPPRKYTLKADSEKKSDNYKLKRARNNDAVRRSRNKAKEAQQKRDVENNKLRDENNRLRDLCKKQAEQIKNLQSENTQLKGGRGGMRR